MDGAVIMAEFSLRKNQPNFHKGVIVSQAEYFSFESAENLPAGSRSLACGCPLQGQHLLPCWFIIDIIRLNGMEFSTLLILFPLIITLHMVEEVLWLPAWSRDAGRWHEPVTTREFAFASAVFLGFIYTLTFFAWRSAMPTLSLYLVLGTAVLMLVNIYWPHLGAAIALRRYPPGLFTALFCNLPFLSYFLWKAFQDQALSVGYFLIASLLMLLAAITAWPYLFRIGRRLFGI